MRKAEILDAQEGIAATAKGKLAVSSSDELRRRQGPAWARIRQARKEMEAETAAASQHVSARGKQKRPRPKPYCRPGNGMHRSREGRSWTRKRGSSTKARAAREKANRGCPRFADVEAAGSGALGALRTMHAVSGGEGPMAHRRTKPSGTSPTPTAIS